MNLKKVYRPTEDLLKEVRARFPKAKRFPDSGYIVFDLVEPDCRIIYSGDRVYFEISRHFFRKLKLLKKYIKYTLGKRDFVMQTKCEKGWEIVTAVKAIKK